MASLLDILEKETRIGVQNYYFEKNKDNLRIDFGNRKNIIYKYDIASKHHLWSIYTEESLDGDVRNFISNELKAIIQANINDASTVKRAADLLVKYSNDTRKLHDQIINSMKAYQMENGLKVIFDSARNVLNFQNGVLELDTGLFRDRTREDYATKCLDYDYTEKYNNKIMKEIIDIYMTIFNNNEYQVNSQLLWDAYCITGEVSDQKFMLYYGESGSNGKSMLLQVKSNVFNNNNGKTPMYVYKCANNFFSPKCKDRDKDIANLVAPCRLAYIEEFDSSSKISMSLVKDITSGTCQNVKLLYQNSMNFLPQFKWSIATNHIPNFDKTDEAFNRRPMIQLCDNKFVDPEEYEKYVSEKYCGTQIYLKDYKLADRFYDINYKIAYVNLLLFYTKAYYKRGSLYNIQYMRREYLKVLGYDVVQEYIDKWIFRTGIADDIVASADVYEHFTEHNDDENVSASDLLSRMKKKLIKHDSTLKKHGKRGFYLGIKILENPRETKPKTTNEETFIKVEKLLLNGIIDYIS